MNEQRKEEISRTVKKLKHILSFQEFHEMSHGLLLWLENIDRRRNEVVPIPPKLGRETLRAHHKTLTVCLSNMRLLLCYTFNINKIQ